MAINKLISIKVPIFEATQDMGIDITRDKPTMAMWAARAAKDIGGYYTYRKRRAVLTINGCAAELPCSAAYLKVVVLGDLGCECGDLMSSLCSWASTVSVSSSEVFLIIDRPETNTYSSAGVTWGVQDNNLIFSKNLDGQKVTVEYLGLEEDCDGFVMVSENYIPAIIEFIMWKFCVRSRFSPIKMELGDTIMHQKEYFRLASDARAMDAELTDSDRAEILAMLHDPFTGRGLDIGMPYADNYY